MSGESEPVRPLRAEHLHERPAGLFERRGASEPHLSREETHGDGEGRERVLAERRNGPVRLPQVAEVDDEHEDWDPEQRVGRDPDRPVEAAVLREGGEQSERHAEDDRERDPGDHVAERRLDAPVEDGDDWLAIGEGVPPVERRHVDEPPDVALVDRDFEVTRLEVPLSDLLQSLLGRAAPLRESDLSLHREQGDTVDDQERRRHDRVHGQDGEGRAPGEKTEVTHLSVGGNPSVEDLP